MLEQLRNQEKLVDDFRALFSALDEDGSGTLTFKELQENLQDLSLQAYFSSLSIEPTKAWDIFRLLDEDGKGELTVEDFVYGCLRLRGVATTIDMASISCDLKKLAGTLPEFMSFAKSELRQIQLNTASAMAASTAAGSRELGNNFSRQAKPLLRSLTAEEEDMNACLDFPSTDSITI